MSDGKHLDKFCKFTYFMHTYFLHQTYIIWKFEYVSGPNFEKDLSTYLKLHEDYYIVKFWSNCLCHDIIWTLSVLDESCLDLKVNEKRSERALAGCEASYHEQNVVKQCLAGQSWVFTQGCCCYCCCCCIIYVQNRTLFLLKTHRGLLLSWSKCKAVSLMPFCPLFGLQEWTVLHFDPICNLMCLVEAIKCPFWHEMRPWLCCSSHVHMKPLCVNICYGTRIKDSFQENVSISE